jgi:hypothetical protein
MQGAPLLHALSHDPQCCGSLVRSAQRDPQAVSPSAHVSVQAAFSHEYPEPQCVPQAEQLLRSVERSAHTPEQLACEVAQVRAQTPEAHTFPPGH